MMRPVLWSIAEVEAALEFCHHPLTFSENLTHMRKLFLLLLGLAFFAFPARVHGAGAAQIILPAVSSLPANWSMSVNQVYVILGVIVLAIVVSLLCSLFLDDRKQTDALVLWLTTLMVAITGLFLLAFSLTTPPIVFQNFGNFSWLMLLYATNSVGTFIFYAYDKAISGGPKKRIPEAVLHFSEWIGGWPGGLAARPILRHKTSWGNKTTFKVINWLIIFVHLAFWVWYFFLRSTG